MELSCRWPFEVLEKRNPEKDLWQFIPCPQDLELEFSYFPSSFKIYTSSHSNILKTPNHTVVKAQIHFLEPQGLTKRSRVLPKRHQGSCRVWPQMVALLPSHIYLYSQQKRRNTENFLRKKFLNFASRLRPKNEGTLWENSLAT